MSLSFDRSNDRRELQKKRKQETKLTEKEKTHSSKQSKSTKKDDTMELNLEKKHGLDSDENKKTKRLKQRMMSSVEHDL